MMPASMSVIVIVSDSSHSQVTVADPNQRFLCGNCDTDELRQWISAPLTWLLLILPGLEQISFRDAFGHSLLAYPYI